MSATYTPKLILHRDAKHGHTGQYPVWEVRSGYETYYVERQVHPDLVPCGAKSIAVGTDGSVVCTFDTVPRRPDGRNHRIESLPVQEHFYVTKKVFLAQQNGTYRANEEEEYDEEDPRDFSTKVQDYEGALDDEDALTVEQHLSQRTAKVGAY